jgi:D-glycero-D-manno-heptose 1,7-bisphosphate phosphatase
MNKTNKAIFLDRDGVLNDLVFYSEDGVLDSPNSVEDFQIITTSIKALKKLKKLGFHLILISNQPGIAKKKYDLKEFNKIKSKMESIFAKSKIKLDAQYYCLHHPLAIDKKYKKNCTCRKPKTKMFCDGIKDFDIDVKKSFVIGDGLVDMKLAKSVKCNSIFIGNVNSTISKIFKQEKVIPSYIAHDLDEAVNYIQTI